MGTTIHLFLNWKRRTGGRPSRKHPCRRLASWSPSAAITAFLLTLALTTSGALMDYPINEAKIWDLSGTYSNSWVLRQDELGRISGSLQGSWQGTTAIFNSTNDGPCTAQTYDPFGGQTGWHAGMCATRIVGESSGITGTRTITYTNWAAVFVPDPSGAICYYGGFYWGPCGHTEWRWVERTDFVEAYATPLLPGMDGSWNLHLDTEAANGRITLASGNVLELSITAITNLLPAGIDVQLQGRGRNHLVVRVVGNELMLQSARGEIAGQTVELQRRIETPLHLAVHGRGAVVFEPGSAPVGDAQLLESGSVYRLSAQSEPGAFFSHWLVNGEMVHGRTVTFTMLPGSGLEAFFVANPYTNSSGHFEGLVDATGAERPGRFRLTLTSNGTFSGRISLHRSEYPFTGAFDGGGFSIVPTPFQSQMEFHLNLSTWELDGVATNGSGTPHRLRALKSLPKSEAVAYAGRYVLTIPGGPAPLHPSGDGFAVLSVERRGSYRLVGALADGTSVNQSGSLTFNGEVPWCASQLYSGNGWISGWLALRPGEERAISGELLWQRGATPSSPFYPAGFTVVTTATGAAFVSSRKGTASFKHGVCSLRDGELAAPERIPFENSTSVTNRQHLSLRWRGDTGLVTGAFLHPQTEQRTVLRGIYFPAEGIARGYFLGRTQAGGFTIESQP